jgi:hypothetical protein
MKAEDRREGEDKGSIWPITKRGGAKGSLHKNSSQKVGAGFCVLSMMMEDSQGYAPPMNKNPE